MAGKGLTKDFTASSSTTGGGAPPALNVISATCTLTYQPWASATVPVFGGDIELPVDTTSDNYIVVKAVSPSGKVTQIASYSYPYDSAVLGFLPYGGWDSSIRQTDSDQTGWSVRFECYNSDNVATAAPFSVAGLTIKGASVASVSGVDASTLSTSDPNYHNRWKDVAGALHCIANITVSLSNSQYPQVVGIWLDRHDGAGNKLQGLWTVTAAGQVVSIGLEGTVTNATYPPTVADEHWTATVAPGSFLFTDAPPSTAITSSSFLVAAPPAPAATAATHAYIDVVTYGTGSKLGKFGWGNLFTDLPFDDPNFKSARWTVQNGHYDELGAFVGGGQHGGLEVPMSDYKEQDVYREPGTNTVSFINPLTWDVPDYKLSDGSLNPNNVFRFRNLVGSPLSRSESDDVTWTYQNDWGSAVGDATPGTNGYLDVVLDLTRGRPSGANLDPLLTVPATVVPLALPFTVLGDLITVANHAITENWIADDALSARTVAANAITAANGALAADSVVDNNVVSVGVPKLISGTCIFTGDVFLSKGSFAPVLGLQNSGLFLYGVAGSGGGFGLTTSPYVAVQAGGISLFSGSDPSVSVTGASITLWGKNGDITKPFVALSNTALQLKNGSLTTDITASQIKLSYTGGASLVLNASQVALQNGSVLAQLSSTALLLSYVGGPSLSLGTTSIVMQDGNYILTLDSTKIKLENASGPSLTLTASDITLLKGSNSLVLTASDVQLVTSTTVLKLTSTNLRMTVPGLSTPVLDFFGTSSVANLTFFTASGASAQLYCDSSTATVLISNTHTDWHVDLNSFGVFKMTVNGSRLLTDRQTGLGSPSGWTDAAALAWAQTLYAKIAAHGFIT